MTQASLHLNKKHKTKNLPYIDTFNHEGTAVIHNMRKITGRVFEHLEITSDMDVDKSIKYTQRILRGTALKKYKQVLEECKELSKGIAGYQWTLGATKDVTMKQFWDWDKVEAINRSGYMCTCPDRCNYLEKELWFELGNIMWRKNWSNFQDNVK